MYPRIRNAVLVSLFALLIQVVAGIPLAIHPELIKISGLQDYYLGIVNTIALGSVSVYGFYRSGLSIKQMLRLPSLWKSTLAATLLLTLPLHLVGVFLSMMTYHGSSTSQALGKVVATVLPHSQWTLLLLAVFIGPLTEEIFFRGFLFAGLLRTKSAWVAGITSTLLFALIHLNSSQIIGALFLGAYAAFSFYTFRSLLFPIAVHMFYNLCIFVLPLMIVQSAFMKKFPP